MRRRNRAPANDEIEVSVFGPGYGEAILVHLGNGNWIAVDSCIDIEDGSCVPLRYLLDIGVNPAKQIHRIVATHWHDDHVRGLSTIVEAGTAARFCCPIAFTRSEFIRFASAYSTVDVSASGTSTSEIYRVLRVLADRGTYPNYVAPDQTIFKIDDGATVYSLSPPNGQIHQFLARLSSLLPKKGETRFRAPDLHPNLMSVVLRIVWNSGAVILGADLQQTPGQGWTTILDNSQCLGPPLASVIKIPHHGSVNAHHLRVWKEMLCPLPFAALSPYNRGANLIPTPADVMRISELTPNGFSTARLTSTAPRRLDRGVELSLAEAGIRIRSSETKMGHVRFRRGIAEPLEAKWTVELFQNAVPIAHVQPKTRAKGPNRPN